LEPELPVPQKPHPLIRYSGQELADRFQPEVPVETTGTSGETEKTVPGTGFDRKVVHSEREEDMA
jgi:hypothetical protein